MLQCASGCNPILGIPSKHLSEEIRNSRLILTPIGILKYVGCNAFVPVFGDSLTSIHGLILIPGEKCVAHRESNTPDVNPVIVSRFAINFWCTRPWWPEVWIAMGARLNCLAVVTENALRGVERYDKKVSIMNISVHVSCRMKGLQALKRALIELDDLAQRIISPLVISKVPKSKREGDIGNVRDLSTNAMVLMLTPYVDSPE